MIALVVVSSNLSNIVLMPRLGPRPLVTMGMLLAAGGMAWLTRIGVHSTYAANVLPPLLVAGAALGMVIAPSINTGTFGVAPQDAGVASASVNTGQQLGGSIGTSLLNTVAASATAAYLTAHVAGGQASASLTAQALVHGYTRAFWWSFGIFVFGAIVAATLFRWGPLSRQGQPAPVAAEAPSSAEPGVVPG
jgi:hypothetical protein